MSTSTGSTISNAKKAAPAKKMGTAKRKVHARPMNKRSKKPETGLSTQLYRQGRDAVSNAYDSAAKATQAVPQIASNLQLRASNLHLRERGQTVYSAMEERPLVTGAIGLGVGMVLAAILPAFIGHRGKH